MSVSLSIFVKTIAERAKWARARLELTQQEVADRAGVSQGTIGNLESGGRKMPREIMAIAKALEVRAEWLKDMQGKPEITDLGDVGLLHRGGRLENLKRVVADRGLKPTDLVTRIGSTYQYWYDLLAGKKSFGEKIARKIEEKLELQRYSLDDGSNPGNKPENIGERIVRLALEKKGWGPVKLAKELNVSYETVRTWQTGKTAPTRKRTEELAKMLGVSEEVIRFGDSRIAEAMDDQVKLDAREREIIESYRNLTVEARQLDLELAQFGQRRAEAFQAIVELIENLRAKWLLDSYLGSPN